MPVLDPPAHCTARAPRRCTAARCARRLRAISRPSLHHARLRVLHAPPAVSSVRLQLREAGNVSQDRPLLPRPSHSSRCRERRCGESLEGLPPPRRRPPRGPRSSGGGAVSDYAALTRHLGERQLRSSRYSRGQGLRASQSPLHL